MMRRTLLVGAFIPICVFSQISGRVVTVLPAPDRSETGLLRLQDKQASTHYVQLRAPATIAATTTWTLPGSDSSGPLCSNGSGVLSFACTDVTITGDFRVYRGSAIRADMLRGGVAAGGIIRTWNAAGDTVINQLDQNGANVLSLSVNGSTVIDSTLTGTFSQLGVLRSGVNRITMLTGGAGAGGLFRTWNAAGDTIINSMDETGADVLTLKVNGATIVDATATGTFSQLGVLRSGVNRVTMLTGGAGAGGLFRTWNAAGDTILNSIDETGADVLTLKVNGATIVDSLAGGTFSQLGVLRSGVNRVTMLTGGAGAGGLFRTWNAAGDTILNSIAETGGDFLSLKVNGSTFSDSSRNTSVHDLTISGTCTGCGGTLPVVDSTDIIKNLSDPTKILRLSAASVATGTTRTLTAQDANYILAGLNIAQTFMAAISFDAGLAVTRSSGAITRVTILDGGASAGGIVNTWDSTGAAILNRFDQNGLSVLNDGGTRGAVTIGKTGTTGVSTATPTLIAMDHTYGSNTVGKNFKIKLFESSAGAGNIYGLGISAGLMEIVAGSGGEIGFFVNDTTTPTELARISTTGVLNTLAGLKVAGTSIVDASRNAGFTSLSIGGTSVIDSSRNAGFTSLSIGGVTVVDSSRNLTVASCSGCLSSLSTSITFSADNTYNVGSAAAEPATLYGHSAQFYRTSTDTYSQVAINTAGSTSAGSVAVRAPDGSNSSFMNNTGIRSDVGYNANGNAGISATFDPNTCASLTFTFGILTAKSGC